MQCPHVQGKARPACVPEHCCEANMPWMRNMMYNRRRPATRHKQRVMNDDSQESLHKGRQPVTRYEQCIIPPVQLACPGTACRPVQAPMANLTEAASPPDRPDEPRSPESRPWWAGCLRQAARERSVGPSRLKAGCRAKKPGREPQLRAAPG